MKALRKIAKAYLLIGALLGTIMWVSYLWATTWGAPAQLTFTQRMTLSATIQPMAFASSIMHGLLWGPSLVVWLSSPGEYSFGMWFAPGAYAERD